MTLTRRYIERKVETKSFYNPNNGNFYSEVSKLQRLGESATLDQAFQCCDTDNLYICPLPKGHYADRDSVYPRKLDLERTSDSELVRYYAKTGSATIKSGEKQFNLYPIKIWFDFKPGDNLSDVIKAMTELEKLLTDAFQPAIVHKGTHEIFPVELLATPANTGMDLLRRKLPIKARYENLPLEIESIIMTQFSQARSELFNHDRPTIEQLYNYDGLWMYASCCRHVPTGRIEHDFENELAMTPPSKNGYCSTIAGFYRVKVTVPATWSHIGLLPTKNPKKDQTRSIYPNIPGTIFESWCSDKELRLARDHGWQFDILERILWPDTQARKIDLGQDRFDRTGQDPLRYWMEALVTLRQETILKYPEPIRGYLKDALRGLLNMGVGKMHSASQTLDIYTEDFDQYPGAGARLKEEYADGSMRYEKKQELTGYQKQTFQPHWPLYLWCFCKYKVTQAALQVPYEHLVSIRTDGLWTTCACDFEDTGKTGCFREHELVNRGPFQYPTNDVECIMMIQNARGGIDNG